MPSDFFCVCIIAVSMFTTLLHVWISYACPCGMLLGYGCNPIIHVVCVRAYVRKLSSMRMHYACIEIQVLTLDSLKGYKKNIKAQKLKWFLHLF